jgi:DNA-binding CsgD family transcriptional regulator
MAAPKTNREDRPAQRQAMLEMRRKGMSYASIARKFKVSKNTPRIILLKVYFQLGIKDAKPAKVA